MRSYRTVSPLPDCSGGLFSVALSLARRPSRWPLAITVSFRVRTFLVGALALTRSPDRGTSVSAELSASPN